MVPASDIVIGQRKYSTVVPATVTEGNSVVHELTNMDLAMKHHYLRGVYYFQDITHLETKVLKEPMFRLLVTYFPVAGRIRVSDTTGRPYIKCNDSGLRIVEARCNVSLEEWMLLHGKEEDFQHQLVPRQFIVRPPNLQLSPLVLVQFTWFEGGGFALGLRWSHVLGDVSAAVSFINHYGQLLAGNITHADVNVDNNSFSSSLKPKPCRKPEAPAVKHVDTSESYWAVVNKQKMATMSFTISETQLSEIIGGGEAEASEEEESPQLRRPFEVISGLIWRCVARIRQDKEPTTITVCRAATTHHHGIMGNRQSITTVRRLAGEMEVGELAAVIGDASGDGSGEETAVDDGLSDVILYGANLTFVDVDGVEVDGLEIQGRRAVCVEYSVDGVGDEGVVLIWNIGVSGGGGGGRRVTVVLPRQQLVLLRQQFSGCLAINCT